MKRTLSIFLAMALTLALAACSSPTGQTGSEMEAVLSPPHRRCPASREKNDPTARPAISGGAARSTVEAWVNGLDLTL